MEYHVPWLIQIITQARNIDNNRFWQLGESLFAFVNGPNPSNQENSSASCWQFN